MEGFEEQNVSSWIWLKGQSFLGADDPVEDPESNLRLCSTGSWGVIERLKKKQQGSLGGAAVWRLPLAQGVILETRDRIPHRAPDAWSLLLPLPVSAPLSLSLCDYHK